MAALAGANVIYGAGMTESGVTFDCAQLVMDDEWAAMIKQVIGGVRVDDEMLMLDDIKSVGPFGDFLSLKSTYRFMRAQSNPRIADRRVREEWQADGATDAYARAHTKALEILGTHSPEPLDPGVVRRLRAIVERADRERGVA
jgi:trimethylamine--corrinoid protein Co-methyltransferase